MSKTRQEGFCGSSHGARVAGKAQYNGVCIISEDTTNIDGAHIFGAGAFPELKCYRQNIVPLRHDFHTGQSDSLDWIVYGTQPRNYASRVSWLAKYVAREYADQLASQLFDLARLVYAIDCQSAMAAMQGLYPKDGY